jgi:hypothetical protein
MHSLRWARKVASLTHLQSNVPHSRSEINETVASTKTHELKNLVHTPTREAPAHPLACVLTISVS